MQPLARKAFDFLPAPAPNRFQAQLSNELGIEPERAAFAPSRILLAAFRKSASETILYRENTESVLRPDIVSAVFFRTPRTGAHGADGSEPFLPFFRPLPQKQKQTAQPPVASVSEIFPFPKVHSQLLSGVEPH